MPFCLRQKGICHLLCVSFLRSASAKTKHKEDEVPLRTIRSGLPRKSCKLRIANEKLKSLQSQFLLVQPDPDLIDQAFIQAQIARDLARCRAAALALVAQRAQTRGDIGLAGQLLLV